MSSIIRRHYQEWAKAAGLATSTVETGAVTGVHRAGASLNVHVHFHLLCLDGVYFEDGEGELRFEPAPGPTRAELASLLERIYARVMKWLRRRQLLSDPDDADASNAPREVSAAEALATAGMQRGTLLTVREQGVGSLQDEGAHAPPAPRVTDAVTHERFNLHATVHLDASDDLGRERLCRYLTRPAFSLARLRVRRDGFISYRVKKAMTDGVTASFHDLPCVQPELRHAKPSHRSSSANEPRPPPTTLRLRTNVAMAAPPSLWMRRLSRPRPSQRRELQSTSRLTSCRSLIGTEFSRASFTPRAHGSIGGHFSTEPSSTTFACVFAAAEGSSSVPP